MPCGASSCVSPLWEYRIWLMISEYPRAGNEQMGGYGSGRSGWKGVLEYCRSLDVNRFNREGMLRQPGWWMWRWCDEDGNQTASIGVGYAVEGLELQYTVNPGTDEAERLHYRVRVTWTPCTYGGERPWFVCPNTYCGRRVGKLYLRSRYFVCRHCTGAAYASQNETREDRLMRKAWKIRRRLGASTDLTSTIWRKPKGMHWRTFERLRDDEAAASYESLMVGFRRITGMLSP
jgi:hypothetical protein